MTKLVKESKFGNGSNRIPKSAQQQGSSYFCGDSRLPNDYVPRERWSWHFLQEIHFKISSFRIVTPNASIFMSQDFVYLDGVKFLPTQVSMYHTTGRHTPQVVILTWILSCELRPLCILISEVWNGVPSPHIFMCVPSYFAYAYIYLALAWGLLKPLYHLKMLSSVEWDEMMLAWSEQ